MVPPDSVNPDHHGPEAPDDEDDGDIEVGRWLLKFRFSLAPPSSSSQTGGSGLGLLLLELIR